MSADRQKKCFNDDRKNLILLEDTLVINIDWKQKINIGLCERQPNANYRNQDLRSCFGCKLYTAILGEVKSVFFVVISDIVEQTAENTAFLLRFIRKHPRFKELDKKHYIFYMDQAKNFKSNLIANYLFVELEADIYVEWRFFTERHG